MRTLLIQCQYCNMGKFFKKPAWKISFKNFWQSAVTTCGAFALPYGSPRLEASAQTICVASVRTFHQTKMTQKNTEEGGSKKTCWVHPYCNRSGERGSFIVTRELYWESRIVHRTVQEHTGNCSVLPFHEWSGSYQLWTNGVFPASSASIILASSFVLAWTSKTFQNTVKSPPSLALFYDCTTDNKACSVVIVSHRPVLNISLSCRLQCARSHQTKVWVVS